MVASSMFTNGNNDRSLEQERQSNISRSSDVFSYTLRKVINTLNWFPRAHLLDASRVIQCSGRALRCALAALMPAYERLHSSTWL